MGVRTRKRLKESSGRQAATEDEQKRKGEGS